MPSRWLRAAAFGALTAFAFSLPSLLRARRTKPAQLFRAAAIELGTVGRKDLVAVGLAGLALAALVIATAENQLLAAGFTAAAVATLLAFRGLAALIQAAAHRGQRRLKPGHNARALRFALATLGRRSAPVASIVLSIGLGLTVLIAVALIQGSILSDFARSMPARAPSFYFIDIQPDQVAALQSTVMATPGASDYQRVPMLRGRIVRMNDVPAEKIVPPKDHEWVLRGDRGLTWSATPDGKRADRRRRLVAGGLQGRSPDLARQGHRRRLRPQARRHHHRQPAGPRGHRQDRQPARGRLVVLRDQLRDGVLARA